jgi:hypothetical protein
MEVIFHNSCDTLAHAVWIQTFNNVIVVLLRILRNRLVRFFQRVFLEMPVPSQESEWTCICVLGVPIWPLFLILIKTTAVLFILSILVKVWSATEKKQSM